MVILLTYSPWLVAVSATTYAGSDNRGETKSFSAKKVALQFLIRRRVEICHGTKQGGGDLFEIDAAKLIGSDMERDAVQDWLGLQAS